MPLTMAAFVIGGLSLIGVPATAGFVSKWYLATALIEASLWPLAFVVLFGSVLALIYIGRVVEVAYYRPVPEKVPRREAPLTMLIPLGLLASANLYFGINSDLSLGLSSLAASRLIGLAP